MNDEDKLRDALRADVLPHVTTGSDDWETVRRRGRLLHRRRWSVRTGVALVAVAAVTVGVLTATGAFDDNPSRSIIATPSPAGNGAIVAALGDGSIVELSAADGHVMRTIIDGLDALGT